MSHNHAEDQVYIFVRDFIRQHGYPPTLREIAAGLYVGTTSVLRCLDILEARGRIFRKPRKSRGISLLDDQS
jgi:repressor LexA